MRPRIDLTTLAVAVAVMAAAMAVQAQESSPWPRPTPPDQTSPDAPPVARSLPNYTGGTAVPNTPYQPPPSSRGESWPGGPTPQPPGDARYGYPATPPSYSPPTAPAYTPSTPPAYVPSTPPAYAPPPTPPEYSPPGIAPAYTPSAPPAYAPTTPAPYAPPATPAYAPPGSPNYPPPASPGYAPPASPPVRDPAPRVASLPGLAPSAPPPTVRAPNAPPLKPFESGLMVAAVGPEAILASDAIATMEENTERVIKMQYEKQSKRLIEAGHGDDLPMLTDQLDKERRRWIDDLREAIAEASDGRLNGSNLTPEQDSHRRLLSELMNQLIEIKLICYDARRTIPKDNQSNVDKQLAKFFEHEDLKRLMKELNVNTLSELDQALRAQGRSLEREKRSAMDRALAQQWIHQQIKVDEEVSYDELMNYYRTNSTEFDKAATTRWQLMSVTFSRHPGKTEAYATIAAMGNRVVGGADFAAVAKAGSDGGGSSDGEIRDWPDQTAIVPQVVKTAIDGLPAGQLSPILEDWRGYYIVRVVERVPAHHEAFEDVQPEIRRKIKNRRSTDEITKYLKGLRQKVPVWTILEPSAGPPPTTAAPY